MKNFVVFIVFVVVVVLVEVCVFWLEVSKVCGFYTWEIIGWFVSFCIIVVVGWGGWSVLCIYRKNGVVVNDLDRVFMDFALVVAKLDQFRCCEIVVDVIWFGGLVVLVGGMVGMVMVVGRLDGWSCLDMGLLIGFGASLVVSVVSGLVLMYFVDKMYDEVI